VNKEIKKRQTDMMMSRGHWCGRISQHENFFECWIHLFYNKECVCV